MSKTFEKKHDFRIMSPAVETFLDHASPFAIAAVRRITVISVHTNGHICMYVCEWDACITFGRKIVER